MYTISWLSHLSLKQHLWFVVTTIIMLVVIVLGPVVDPTENQAVPSEFETDMPIMDIILKE